MNELCSVCGAYWQCEHKANPPRALPVEPSLGTDGMSLTADDWSNLMKHYGNSTSLGGLTSTVGSDTISY